MQELDAQRIKDEDHLKLLGVFNYVFAGLLLLGALMILPQIFMVQSGVFQDAFEGAFEEARTEALEDGRELSAPPEMFEHMDTFFTVFLVAWMVISVIAALLSFLSGRNLRRHRSRGFSQFVAALQCLVVPLGTVLGIFTFVVLGRPTVRQAYDESGR